MTIIAAAFALTLALLVGMNAHSLGHKLGLLDWPDLDGGRKRHARVTPLVGGTAICLSIVGAALLAQGYIRPMFAGIAAHLGWLAAAVLAMYAMGLVDDRTGLSPRIRLLVSVAALLLLLWMAPGFTLDTLRFSGAGFSYSLGGFGLLFTMLCLVGLMNAVNMADGKNGLVISLALLWSLMLAVHAPPALLPVLAAAVAALSVILWFNMRGHCFLGDGGSYGISTAVGLLAIYIHNLDPAAFRADEVAVMFVVPVLDTVRLMSLRLARGSSPFSADRDHLHHYLARRWGWPKGLYIYLTLVGAPMLLAVLVERSAPIALLIAVATYSILLVVASRAEEGLAAAEHGH